MIVALRRCAICGEDYTPHYRYIGGGEKVLTETCGQSKCRVTLARSRQNDAERIARERETKAHQRAVRIAGVTRRLFGELSPRELAIFVVGRREGYQDGFNKGMAAAKRGPEDPRPCVCGRANCRRGQRTCRQCHRETMKKHRDGKAAHYRQVLASLAPDVVGVAR